VDIEPVDQLIAAAARGDKEAWSRLVRRYSPLILSVIRGYRLNPSDISDAYQTVWLRLVEHLERLRDPAALPMWITTTTRRECYRLLQLSRRTRPFDPLDETAEAPSQLSTMVDDAPLDENLLRAERYHALREAYAQLPDRCQHLLSLLMGDPPMRYQQVSERMEMPVGSVGPTLGRCLRKLRECPAMSAFVAGTRAAEGEEGRRNGVAAR
jgi:RNA polymerase sigma factor (sigma-70 family)